MHVNIENLTKINPQNLALLLILKQAGKSDLSEAIAMAIVSDEELQNLEEMSFIKYIKGKKGENKLQRMRLDKMGTKYLTSLEEPSVLEEDLKVLNWLSDDYIKRDKQIGNKKRTARMIAAFREKSGIAKNQLVFLCQEFISDESQQEYSFRLEYVFHKPQPYKTTFVLDDSRLWQYYQNRKDYFDKKFSTIPLENKTK